ncbi:MAG: hypothetical protein CMI60_23535 [Parvibaculum sp.]|nr:hypothetical protein [Parvibaculum sp.]
MARISTYENSSPVLLTDKVIGTNVSGTPTNVTKNFLISDLLTLFQSNITLQNVLDAGNTATQSIVLTGAITQTGDFGITGNLTQAGGALTLGGTVRDFNGALGNNGETLVCNASGQLVFGSGLTNQNLDQVLAIGNTATNDINLTGNIVQTGNYIPTGDITHVGAYNFSGGQFTTTATGTMVLGGALTCNSSISLTGTVKDYTDTLGGANQFLVSDASGQVTWQSTLPSPLASSALTVINLALSNAEGVVVTTAATATDVRIPTNAGIAFPIGTKVTIIQEGAGQVTIAPTAGVTVNSAVGLKTNAQFAVAHVVKTATDTWYAYGNLTP